jgi:hypothetical protein
MLSETILQTFRKGFMGIKLEMGWTKYERYGIAIGYDPTFSHPKQVSRVFFA